MSNSQPKTGIAIRQALDPSSTVFTNSPDLILTGTAAAADPSAFSNPDAYDWYFSQAPTIGSANNVYIRGVNYTPTGTQQSRVYLYFAQSDQLLDPTKWQSSGFTLNSVAQNYTPISAKTVGAYVATAMPVMWTPPAPTTAGATYYLISWIDNSQQPSPPTFPTTPFADLAALGTYVSQHPSMAVLDTVYRGAFLRQLPGQTVQQPGTGAQTSPDIIVNGAAAAQDASSFAGSGSYNAGTLSANAALGVRNFVYVRALNTVAGPARARVYLYWTTAAAISAPSWSAGNFTFAGQPQNWVDLTATAAGQVMVSTVPLVWYAPSGPAILAAYVDNSTNPQPPDFTPFGYLNPQAVTSFVASHPQLAWVAVTGTAAAQPTMSWETPLVAGTGMNSVYAGIQLTSIPTDGTLSLSIPGPDAANTLVIQSMRVPNQNALVAWPVTYPDHFQTSAVLTYTQGSTPVGAGSIVLKVVQRPTG